MEAMASSGSKLQSKIRSEKPSSPSFRSSSSPTLSVKHEKSVYVRFLNSHRQEEWYSFTVNGSGEEDEKRKRGPRGFFDHIPVTTPFYLNEISLDSSSAVVDSTIYSVGGISEGPRGRLLDRVCRLDTEQSRKKAPSMPDARLVVALNGKIYVMGGGNEDCDFKPWGEVFNPESNTWVTPFLHLHHRSLYSVLWFVCRCSS